MKLAVRCHLGGPVLPGGCRCTKPMTIFDVELEEHLIQTLMKHTSGLGPRALRTRLNPLRLY